MMDQKQFDALLDKWIEEHKQEMIDELGLWVGQAEGYGVLYALRLV